MEKFCLKMVASENARRLYVRCMLILILLYHYVYAGGYFGEWGIVVSTIICAILFSFKRKQNGSADFMKNGKSSF